MIYTIEDDKFSSIVLIKNSEVKNYLCIETLFQFGCYFYNEPTRENRC